MTQRSQQGETLNGRRNHAITFPQEVQVAHHRCRLHALNQGPIPDLEQPLSGGHVEVGSLLMAVSSRLIHHMHVATGRARSQAARRDFMLFPH